ncbi:MAG: lysophospholipid acyltransferase family protein [Reichenbachiella sp.]|uniref:lysophospholipid acyltransferase family protein n=1 Tax=Reichenbachiella sp. TaxID=2184521 RepID=UPI0032631864
MATWDGKTKGTLLGYQIFVWMVQTFGLNISYLFLKTVAFYYYIFARRNKRVLQYFYETRLGNSRTDANKLIKKNFYLLAQSILDKIAFATGQEKKFTFSNEGEDRLVALANEKKGGVLVSAHFGNWDIAGQILKNCDAIVNVVMYDNEHENIKEFLEKKSGVKYHVIAQKEDMSHLFKIYQAVKRGELICMHGDRFINKEQTIKLDFLGAKASFPSGPFKMIKKLRVPYAFVFATKTDDRHYHFTSTVPKLPEEEPNQIAQSFANVLEEKVKVNPEQWFNYYDFHKHP